MLLSHIPSRYVLNLLTQVKNNEIHILALIKTPGLSEWVYSVHKWSLWGFNMSVFLISIKKNMVMISLFEKLWSPPPPQLHNLLSLCNNNGVFISVYLRGSVCCLDRTCNYLSSQCKGLAYLPEMENKHFCAISDKKNVLYYHTVYPTAVIITLLLCYTDWLL